jgi:hypothetical protein
MTYVLLIYRATATGDLPPEFDDRATLDGHRKVQRETAARGDLHAVARLDESRAAHTVRRRGGAHDIVDGPFIETKEWLVGFYLVDCRDDAEAVEHAKTICADDEHAVEVRKATWRYPP